MKRAKPKAFMVVKSFLNPKRTIAELKELRERTSDGNGAQRVAFTTTWLAARAWLGKKLKELPVETHQDAAGNVWSTLPGDSDRALLLGGHIDSVPNGGWLDGCLNLLAGLEVLRRINAQYSSHPPFTLRLVNWADEEGARFGKSLFGSSACAGDLNLQEARALRDKNGIGLADALEEIGLDLEHAGDSAKELKHAAAYLELHIEQGPVLLDLGLPLGAVLGTCGVQRHALTFHGQAAHSGSTPMNLRHDAFLAAARMSPETYQIARRHGGVATIGSCVTKPGVPTIVVEECRITLDERHLQASALAAMLEETRHASERFAEEGRVRVDWETLLRIEPVLFHPELIDLCDAAIRETSGTSHRLPSGPLHDASAVARAGVPTVMMFVQSLRGISHNKIEDTREDHLELSVAAFDKLAEKTMHWLGRSL
jgi:N-carbamoyl-L-amino-acid hydrolase